MAITPFTPTGTGGTNIPISNGSNQTFEKINYGNAFHALLDKPEWDDVIHERFDEAPFVYILDKKLQETEPLKGNVYTWTEYGHKERYQTAQSVTVSSDEASVTIPNTETQLFGVGSVIMSPSGRQYRVEGFAAGVYTLSTVNGLNAAVADFGNIVSEALVGGKMWHLYDATDPCGVLVKGATAFPNVYTAWANIVSTNYEYCYDEMTQPIWVAGGYYYNQTQKLNLAEHQKQKEKQIVFSQGIGTTDINSTPGIIPQLFSRGTSYTTAGAITDKVLLDYDAMLKTNGGGRGEYCVLVSHQNMAAVSMAMKDYRVPSYNGLFKDVKEGKFTFELESFRISGTIYHFIAYDFFSFAPMNAAPSIDYNNVMVFLNVMDGTGSKCMTIKYVASPITGRKENTKMTVKNGQPTAGEGGQRVTDDRCWAEGISSKYAFIFQKVTKSGLLITTSV